METVGQMSVDALDRAQGCLVGLAVGDALGGPLEFMSREQILITHGVVSEMIGGGWLALRQGETTDDTAMALALADGLAELGRFDAKDVAARYVAWYRTGPRDIGNTTHASLAIIAGGGDVETASRLAKESLGDKTAGNGTVMRVAPIAILYRDDDAALVRSAMADARITHFDPECAMGSASLALLLARLMRGEAREAALGSVAAFLDANDIGIYDILPDWKRKSEDALRPTGYVVDTLETALWEFAHARSFEECLVRTVNLGGDADTTGSVAGALAGAHFGLSGIPERWRGALVVRGKVQALARRLHGLSTKGRA